MKNPKVVFIAVLGGLIVLAAAFKMIRKKMNAVSVPSAASLVGEYPPERDLEAFEEGELLHYKGNLFQKLNNEWVHIPSV